MESGNLLGNYSRSLVAAKILVSVVALPAGALQAAGNRVSAELIVTAFGPIIYPVTGWLLIKTLDFNWPAR